MTTTPRIAARDTFAFDWYLFKVDLLMAGLPNSYVSTIRKDLRRELKEAAREQGMRAAIQDLGPAQVLAHNYREAYGRPVPRVWAGIIAFAVILYGWLLGVISLCEGLIASAEQLHVTTPTTVTHDWLFVHARLNATPEGIESFGFTLEGLGLIGFLATLIIVPFICAKGWRAWNKHQP
ncbi:hypothetical protein [Timonella sp. A28]|uniref:hypothetical protein n=1 Tax=Timonella sp. A28 TaxID=3442640 RepID=UPI003EB69742